MSGTIRFLRIRNSTLCRDTWIIISDETRVSDNRLISGACQRQVLRRFTHRIAQTCQMLRIRSISHNTNSSGLFLERLEFATISRDKRFKFTLDLVYRALFKSNGLLHLSTASIIRSVDRGTSVNQRWCVTGRLPGV